jgi:hypothetical protein
MYTYNPQYKPFFGLPISNAQTRVENLYEHLYKAIPSTLAVFDTLDKRKVLEYLQANYTRYLSNLVYQSDGSTDQSIWISKDASLQIVIEVSNLKLGFTSKLIEDLDSPSSGTCALNAASESLEELEELYRAMSVNCLQTSKSKIHMLVNYYGEVDLKPLDSPAIEVDIQLNYGKSFLSVSDSIVESLNSKTSGLYLFYGEPGTGKSSYIKYLLSGVLKRKVVYVPINLINSLMSPDFLPLLLNNQNTILVIEDAEKALLSREDSPENSSLVSSILNLTDSFISTTLNISIVATFNTARENLDKALLRKGRLRHSYEFKKLCTEEAQALVDSLGFDYKATEAMTLADIYNLYENSGHVDAPKKVVTGFGS